MPLRLAIVLALLLAAALFCRPTPATPHQATATPTLTPTLDQLHIVTPRPWPATPTPVVPHGGVGQHAHYLPLIGR